MRFWSLSTGIIINFIFGGLLWYIDYECNEYMTEWDFEHWGIRQWLSTVEFRPYREKDYEAVCAFLIALNQNDKKHINWNWARFEWMMEHPEFSDYVVFLCSFHPVFKCLPSVLEFFLSFPSVRYTFFPRCIYGLRVP